MTYKLAFDTANEGLSVALFQGEVLLEEIDIFPTRQQAELLADTVKTLLERHHLAPAHLSEVYVTEGPGGFSGVRVGLAFARAFAGALGVPLTTWGTLEVIAQGLPLQTLGENEGAVVALAAGRGQLYLQGFSAHKTPLTEVHCMTPSEVETTFLPLIAGRKIAVLAGSGVSLWPSPAGEEGPITFSDARVKASVLGKMPSSLTTAEAVYIRPPDAKLPTPRPRK